MPIMKSRNYNYDPYLLALVNVAKVDTDRIGNPGWPRCFPGYETNTRHLILKSSGLKIQCVENGWLLDATALNVEHRKAYNSIVENLNIKNDQHTVLQINGVDANDRIKIGVTMLNAFIRDGL